MRYIFTLLFALSLSPVLFAQEDCTTAPTVSADGTCFNGTTVGASDNWSQLVGCQSGGGQHPDVWYKFVATGSVFNATVTTSAPFTGNVEFILGETGLLGCSGGVTILTSKCGASPLTVSAGGLVAGNTYYFTISNTPSGTPGPFSVCPSTTSPPLCSNDNQSACSPQTVTLGALATKVCANNECNTGLAMGPSSSDACYNFSNTPTSYYTVSTPASAATMAVEVTTAGLLSPIANPKFMVFRLGVGASCSDPSTWTLISCTQGGASSASATAVPVSPLTTYIIAVGSQTGASGNYNFCVTPEADKSACNKNDALTVTATSLGSPLTGPFQAGEEVTFCYTITDWTQASCNYLQAIVPTFGDCWDPVSFDAQGRPVTITTALTTAGTITCPTGPCGVKGCEGTSAGTWSWMPTGSATYNNISGGYLPPNSPVPAGWFFLTSYDAQNGDCTPAPTDPDQSYGDANYPLCNQNTLDWQVCFRLRAKGDCATGTNCSVTMKTYADGEIGTWSSIGCTADQPAVYNSTLFCCTPPAAQAGPDVAICSGDSVLIGNPAEAGMTYSWSPTTGLSSSTVANPKVSLTNTGTTPTSTTYIVTVSNGSCSNRDTVVVTVNPRPVMTSATTATAICSGVTVGHALTSNIASSFSWVAAANANVGGESTTSQTGATISDILTNATTGQETVTYTVTPTSTTGSCPGTPQTVTVAVNPRPTMTSSATPPAICSGVTVGHALTSDIPSSFTWVAAANANVGGESTTNQTGATISDVLTNTTTAQQTVTYTVTPTSTTGSCTGTPQTVTVTVNPRPVMTSATTTSVCSGTALNFGLTANIGSTFSWQAADNTNVTGESTTPQTGNTINNTLTTSSTTSQTVTYSVTPTSTTGNCVGAVQTVTVTVNPKPVMTSATNTSVCSGTALNFGLTANVASSFSWQAADNTNVTGESTTPQTGSTINNTLNTSSTTPQVVNYSVTPTATTGGCVGDVQTVAVTVNPRPTMTSPTSTSVCSGTALNFGLTATIASTFTWQAADNTSVTGESTTLQTGSTINNTLTTSSTTPQIVNYTVTPTATTGGCTGTAQTVAVTVNPRPVMTSATSTSVCSGTPLNFALTANLASTFSWQATDNTNVSGESTTAQTGNTINNTLTTTSTSPQVVNYSVTPTATTGGCAGSAQTVAVTVNPVPDAEAGPGQTLTCSATSVTLNGTGSTTTTGVIYNWTPSANIVSGQGTLSPVVNVADTYTITVTLNGCSATDVVTVISDPSVPTADAGPADTLKCNKTSVTLQGSGTTGANIQYVWSGPAGGITSGQGTLTPTVNIAGTYNLEITNTSNGCKANDNVIIAQNTTPPTVNTTGAQVITCSNPTATVDASASTANGPMSFVWTGPGIVSGGTTSAAVVNAAGSYSVTVTNTNNGCSAGALVSVSENKTAPTADAGSDNTLTCTTTSVTVGGSNTTTGMNYQWQGAGITSATTNSTATVNTAGTYTLTVTNPANGCNATDQVIISSNTTAPTAAVAAPGTITCINSTVTLNAGGSTPTGVSYQWSGTGITTGATTATPTVNAPGTFTVTVTDPANGCTDDEVVTVIQNTTAPIADAGSDQILTCSSPSLTVGGTNTTAGLDYSWSGPGVVSGGTSATASVNAAGIYTLTVTDPANGCTASDDVEITADANVPTADAGSPQTLTCLVTQVTLDGSASTAGLTYTWNGPAGFTASGVTTTATAPGTYTLTVFNAANNCQSTAEVTVAENITPPVSDAGADQMITCATPDVTIGGTNTTPANATYQWSGPGITGSATTSTTTANANGTYTLTVTDATNGCTATDEVEVTTDASVLTVLAGSDATLTCLTTSVTIGDAGTSSGPDITYSWAGPGITGTVSTVTTNVTVPGTYTLTATNNANGCTGTDEVTVNQNNTAPVANAGTDQTITCTVSVASLNGSSSSAGMDYLWTGPSVTSGATTTNATASAAGTYTLTVTDPSNGCASTDEVSVIVDQAAPDASVAPASDITCASTTSTLQASSTTPGTMNYSWSGTGIVSGGSTSSATVNAGGTFTVTVTNPNNGCSTTVPVTVSVNTTAPSAAIASPANISCSGGTITLDATGSSSGATIQYQWAGPGVASGGSTASPAVSAAGTYTLTVTDASNGCSSISTVAVAQDPSPIASFTPSSETGVTPATITFTNNSANANSYMWYFGTAGNDTSTATNPSFTYTLKGTYVVSLVASNGVCKDSTSVTLTIVGESLLIVPNVFTPNGDGHNDFFAVKAESIKTFRADIFDRWGIRVFDLGGTEERWDGRTRSGTELPEGTYFIQVLEAVGLDGKDWNTPPIKQAITLFRK